MGSRRFLLVVAILLGCGDNGSTVNEPGNTRQVDAVGATSWSPATITIKAGEVVTFRNSSSSIPHNVQFDQAAAGHPANVGDFTGSSKSVTFATAGTYAYKCGIHPVMQGQVIVQP